MPTNTSPAVNSPLTLLVTERKSAELGRRLVYRLTPTYKVAESGPIEGNPVAQVREFLAGLERAPLRSEEDKETAKRKSLSLGLDLARQLIPQAVRTWLLEQHRPGRPLIINSSETWVPWEVFAVETPDPGRPPLLLSHGFALCRQRSGQQAPTELSLDRLAYVMTPGSGLRHAKREIETIKACFRSSSEIDAHLNAVQDELNQGTFDAWHIVSHGYARGDSADHWGIALEGEGKLKSSDLNLALRGLRSKRPLVFLNACHGGRGGYQLVGAGGLAQKFVDAGARAVIAATFAVDDEPAACFAAQVYTGLSLGLTLGEAVRRARCAISDLFDGNPTHLAYAVYGDPLARVLPAEATSEPLTLRPDSSAQSTDSANFQEEPAGLPARSVRFVSGSAVSRSNPPDADRYGSRRSGPWSALSLAKLAGLIALILIPWLAWTAADRDPANKSTTPATLRTDTPAESLGDRVKSEKTFDRSGGSDLRSKNDAEPEARTVDDPTSGQKPLSPVEPSDRNEESTVEQAHAPDEFDGTASVEAETSSGTFAIGQPEEEVSESVIETASETASVPSEPVAEKATRSSEQYTLAAGKPVVSRNARCSLSVDFQAVGQVPFVKVTIAPEGLDSIDEVFYRQGGETIRFETLSGKWIVQILSVNYGNKTLVLQLSQENTL